MKKIIIFTMLLIISVASFSQQTTATPPAVKTDYLKKSKNQKTAAWILMGGGSVLAAVGFVVILNEAVTEIGNIFETTPQKTSNTGEILFYPGIAAMAGSIPLFIASHRNKKKGLSLSFKNETAPLLQKNSFVNHFVPSLTLKISL
jgi:hypothetical protein